MIAHHQKSLFAGYTIIEIIEFIIAIILARWLADNLSSHFEGTWHTVVFWIVAIVGNLVFFLCLLFAFGYLFECCHKSPKPPKER